MIGNVKNIWQNIKYMPYIGTKKDLNNHMWSTVNFRPPATLKKVNHPNTQNKHLRDLRLDVWDLGFEIADFKLEIRDWRLKIKLRIQLRFGT